jgi:hypothetical protein
MSAQEAPVPRHTGVPQDWSQRHIVFSRDTLARHPNLMYREPRVLHQAIQRWQAPNSDVFRGANLSSAIAPSSGQHPDWNVAMAGHVSFDMSPAKFSFDAGAPPDCTNDYVVFGLAATGSTGTGGHANLVGFNQLYSGTSPVVGLCGTAPNVLFAYNITTAGAGRILTSPVLSLDGKKIAFVESIPGTAPSAVFHVLTWTAGQGTIAVPAAPTMTSLTFSSSADDTTSSPWIDYGTDTAYVGSDKGFVYQITGVFKGTPTLSGSPWPVSAGTLKLTPPVLDSVLGRLMVGSANGSLYRIDTATGAVSTLVVGAARGGILGAPIVDITNGTTFVVSANDGASAVLVEADTASLNVLTKGRIGQGASAGTSVPLYEPAFSNDYYTNPSSGVIRLCGTGAADTTPYQFAFGFTGRIMHSTPSFSQQLLTSTAARCTGWTEFFNPNIGTTLGTDFFFFGLTQDCTGTGTAGGCVARITNSNTTLVTATVAAGPSGVVVDNYSAAAQAASFYFTAENLQTAYKFTQSGLN